ncbi:MAG: putative LPS assembly protein LptD [Melioribacter sp.]|nr:putative LPS assembly protein LptD [Melioribacter sp.]
MKRIIVIIFFFNVILNAKELCLSNTDVIKSIIEMYTDTLAVDTIESGKKFDVDDVVYASASDSIIFDITTKKMFVYGNGQLKYKDTELKSGKIEIDYNTNQLEAFGILDSLKKGKPSLIQMPVLKEGSETYEGNYLKYNFKTQKGFISLAKNEMQGTRYEGEKVKKIDKNIYFIKHGMFTTCERDTPHTYFTADEMKVIQKDKVFARWIFMHIEGVPFPIPLPFAVFPSEGGRRSGIIVPSYGKDIRRGQYFYNLGYFWAISDYIDFTVNGDYYTKGGYGLRSRIRYAKRYDFNGSLNAGYSKIKIGESNDPIAFKQDVNDWSLSWYHNHQINPSTQLNMNLQFYSSSYLKNNSVDYNDILSQNIISNATFSKVWEESGNNLVINYSRTQNLVNGDIFESLPNITFTKNISYPFRNEASEVLSKQKWYEQIGYTYTGQFLNNKTKSQGNLSLRGGIQHSLNISASPKIGYFSIAPRLNYSEKWYNKRIKKENIIVKKINSLTGEVTEKDSIVTRDINEINFVRTFDFSVTANTKLYGIFQPNIFGIEAFRHTLTPSITYVYKPDFSSDFWNYYDYYTTSKGEKIKYDKFSNEVFRGADAGQQQSLNFALGNVFEIKTSKEKSDTLKKTSSNKIQLLNLSASIGYNFAQTEFKLSDLNLTYRTQIGNLISFYGSSNYTFYDYENNTKINRFLISAKKGLLRLTNFSISVTTNLNDKIFKTDKKNSTLERVSKIIKEDSLVTNVFSPWDLSLSYNFNLSKYNPAVLSKYSSLGIGLNFSLTKNWKFTIRGSYDFELKQITTPQITIYRDLHCWEMNFIWNPVGNYKGFRFEIRMKAPELQDIKITKSRGLYSGRR